MSWFASQAPAVIAVALLMEMRFALATFKAKVNRRLLRLERFRRYQLRREHQRHQLPALVPAEA